MRIRVRLQVQPPDFMSGTAIQRRLIANDGKRWIMCSFKAFEGLDPICLRHVDVLRGVLIGIVPSAAMIQMLYLFYLDPGPNDICHANENIS